MIDLENHMVIGDYYHEGPIPEGLSAICDGCGETFWEDDVIKWAGERRCADCRPRCPSCDEPALEDGMLCDDPLCAYWAMGVEI